MRLYTGGRIDCETAVFDQYEHRPNILVTVQKHPRHNLRGKWVQVYFSDSSYTSSLCLDAAQTSQLIEDLKKARRLVVRRTKINFKGVKSAKGR